MLAISKPSTCDTSSVNIVPCRIDHNGPTKVTKRYWQTRTEVDGTRTAYFRGRKLRGKLVKIPQRYHGMVLKSSDETLVEAILPGEEDEDEEPELPESIKVVEQVSTFGQITIWGHDHLPAMDDNLVKGIEEWIALAEAIHV